MGRFYRSLSRSGQLRLGYPPRPPAHSSMHTLWLVLSEGGNGLSLHSTSLLYLFFITRSSSTIYEYNASCRVGPPGVQGIGGNRRLVGPTVATDAHAPGIRVYATCFTLSISICGGVLDDG